ncbi:uncharacterized protein LOC131970347 [Centropristis striata]|uniref:uncharacterized protein LOC131970347 n=1 Tax=Centropristis striata TaxID=184440 RepID=UPI0027E17AAD|nr:uncharacterized protein LOC131970347 [Centropristis striata]
MTSRKDLMRLLLISTLLLTGVSCKKNAVFVYSRLGGDAVLPCINPESPDCSRITWTFYKGGRVRYTEEVINGEVRSSSDKASRMALTSNCSLSLQSLMVDDAGSYVCKKQDAAITDVYLSLLSVTSPSSITDLQPGGNLSLSCILFTYYDVGSCKSYSNTFNLSWTAEDGSTLPTHTRNEHISDTRCNITLLIKLQSKDDNRKWRCQVNTAENSRVAFIDFTSTFLFLNRVQSAQTLSPPAACPVQLPISRIVLCVALPFMVITVGFFTWRTDRHRARTSAAAFKLQEIYE